MACKERKFDRGPALRSTRTWCTLTVQVCTVILLGLLWARAARNTEISKAPGSRAIPGAQIAYADFDGDRQMDLATVQAGLSEGSRTRYSVRLRLTAAGRQSIQILGPAGGLEITARDVNGDQAVDLVLTAAWLKEPVAILLNDGHGHFSRIDPSVYPDAFHDSNGISDGSLPATSLAAANLSQWRAEISALAADLLSARPLARLSRPADPGFPRASYLTARQCRAPPARASIL